MEMEIAPAEVAREEATALLVPRRTQQTLPGATDQVRVKRETIKAVLEQCQRALKLLEEPGLIVDTEPDVNVGAEAKEKPLLSFSAADSDADVIEIVGDHARHSSSPSNSTPTSAVITTGTKEMHTSNNNQLRVKLCEMVKSKVESQSFLEKLGFMHRSVSQSNSAWEMVCTSDFLEDKKFCAESKDLDGYVLVNQEDIVEGIVSFMAGYLLSLKETKELSPNQLQKALDKAFSAKKKRSKIRKTWEGSQVIYNVASWGATAVGIYQNPVIIKGASVAIWSFCRAISKFV